MSNRITRRGIPINDNAARLGSGGGKGTDRHEYDSTTASAAQPRCTKVSGWRSGTRQHPIQMRLFALDGALSEPYMPARAGNDAAMSAASGEGRAGR